MTDHILDDRRVGLENAFFAKQDALLRRRLAEADELKTRRESLAAASGIQDPAALDKLLDQNVTAATLAALSLVPLVTVVWADGHLEPRERSAILSSAEQAGMDRQQASYRLLESWLATTPPPELMATWRAYVSALAATLGDAPRRDLKAKIMGQAREVAEAAGGIMGFGHKVSSAEAAVLDELERMF